MNQPALREQKAPPLSAFHIAPCGMNCALCMAYVRDKKPCPGCHGEDAQKPFHCVNCSIRHCGELGNGGRDLCVDCGKFPCRRLKQLDKRYREKYRMSLVDNLRQIKEAGMDAFLAGQVDRWTCTTCGGFICVHRGYCVRCGG